MPILKFLSIVFFNLIKPIQATANKKADFLEYLLTRLIDVFVMRPVFFIDLCIHLFNSFISFIQILFLFCQMAQVAQVNPQLRDKLIASIEEWRVHSVLVIGAAIAFVTNDFLSMLSLFTRPVVSLFYYFNDGNQEIRAAPRQQTTETEEMIDYYLLQAELSSELARRQQHSSQGIPQPNNSQSPFKPFSGEGRTLGS